MLSDRAKDALDGIRTNLQAIADFIGNMTFEQFAADKLTFYAVTRALEIISEASRRLPDDFKERYPRIRWRSIRDAGNVYRHGYAQVSEAEVWDTAASQLDELRALVSRELGEHAPEARNVPPDRNGKEESDT